MMSSLPTFCLSLSFGLDGVNAKLSWALDYSLHTETIVILHIEAMLTIYGHECCRVKQHSVIRMQACTFSDQGSVPSGTLGYTNTLKSWALSLVFAYISLDLSGSSS